MRDRRSRSQREKRKILSSKILSLGGQLNIEEREWATYLFIWPLKIYIYLQDLYIPKDKYISILDIFLSRRDRRRLINRGGQDQSRERTDHSLFTLQIRNSLS